MDEDDTLFCENKNCRVIVFKPVTGRRDHGGNHPVAESNCPGWGQFGSTKDK